jgi:hypothetical protein
MVWVTVLTSLMLALSGSFWMRLLILDPFSSVVVTEGHEQLIPFFGANHASIGARSASLGLSHLRR